MKLKHAGIGAVIVLLLAILIPGASADLTPGPGNIGSSTNNPIFSSIQDDAGAIASNNPLPSQQPDGPLLPFSIGGGGVPTGFPVDLSTGIGGVWIDLTTAGGGGVGSNNTIQFQESNDNTNWANTTCLRDDNLPTATITGANLYWCPAQRRWFRLNVSSYGSGTISGNVVFKSVFVPNGVAPPASLVLNSTGGVTTNHYISLNATNSRHITTVQTALVFAVLSNPTGTIAYLHLYNSKTDPTCTTADATLLSTIAIPPTTAIAPININFGPVGMNFNSGLAYCITALSGDGDNTSAVAAVVVDLGYK